MGFDYPNLEPNHVLRDDGDVLVVACPYLNPETGIGFETTWSRQADLIEVNCLFCETLNGAAHHLGAPTCFGTGEDDE